MKINISKDALSWYEENINFETNKYLRFIPSLKRKTKTGFSLHVMPLEPTKIGSSFEYHDITYYIESSDIWFFPGGTLNITLDKNTHEPNYEFVQV